MACDSSPHNACGQILFSLKMSRLNYLVKETPYSAYVTIRKKFIQSHEAIQHPFTNMSDEKDNISKQEMNDLEERNYDLETKIAILTIALDEAEDKNKELQRENIKIKDSIEDVYKEKEIKLKKLKFESRKPKV